MCGVGQESWDVDVDVDEEKGKTPRAEVNRVRVWVYRLGWLCRLVGMGRRRLRYATFFRALVS